MSDVQLCEISLAYEQGIVLEGIDLTLRQGEYAVVLGASACGKTSLLRMIAGLIRPTAGRIFLAGKDVRNVPPRKRDVALVPQQAGLYPHLAIGESIRLGIRERLSKRECDRRIAESARIVGIETLLDRLPQTLSGGQIRRAAVAKAIASRASVRLLDEPLAAVDANLRFQIERDLRRLHLQTPGVTIHVTHDGAEAMRMADRLAVIEQGRIAQIDTPERIRTDPVSPGVAAALGQSPLVTVALRRRQNRWVGERGEQVGGPEAADGATATAAYYEADQTPLDAAFTSQPGDWVDVAGNMIVPRDKLFWFVD
jgi:ABC-type sugar transport system ATPase subunit